MDGRKDRWMDVGSTHKDPANEETRKGDRRITWRAGNDEKGIPLTGLE